MELKKRKTNFSATTMQDRFQPTAPKGNGPSFEDIANYPRRAEIGRKELPVWLFSCPHSTNPQQYLPTHFIVKQAAMSFSPDDKNLTYLQSNDGTLTRKLFALSLATGDARQLFSSPDG